MNAVFKLVQQLVPSISPMNVISSFAGCRAADVSEDFVINSKNNFINAAGIQSPGLTASPAIGKVLVQYITEILNPARKEEWNYKPLSKRFNCGTTEEKTLLAQQDVNHTKIICSCEMVTEADV